MPAEGEDTKTEEDTTVDVVKTTWQHAKERAEYEKDDSVCAESGAAPLDLDQLDNSLFVESKTRKKLTKREK